MADIVRCPLALAVGTLGRPLAWFLDTARIHTPNGTSIGSAVFVGRTIVTNRQTDRPPSIGNYSRHLMISIAMRSNESQIPLHGPDPTRSDRTRLLQDMSVPATRSPTKSGPCQIPLHGPTDFVCDPTRQDRQTKSVYMSRLSGQVYDVGGLAGDPSGPWVGSGRFCA